MPNYVYDYDLEAIAVELSAAYPKKFGDVKIIGGRLHVNMLEDLNDLERKTLAVMLQQPIKALFDERSPEEGTPAPKEPIPKLDIPPTEISPLVSL